MAIMTQRSWIIYNGLSPDMKAIFLSNTMKAMKKYGLRPTLEIHKKAVAQIEHLSEAKRGDGDSICVHLIHLRLIIN